MTFKEFAKHISLNPLIQAISMNPEYDINRRGLYIAVYVTKDPDNILSRKIQYYADLEQAIADYGDHDIDEFGAMIVYKNGVAFRIT